MENNDWNCDDMVLQNNMDQVAKPEYSQILLFGKWTYENIEISDLSLQVNHSIIKFYNRKI